MTIILTHAFFKRIAKFNNYAFANRLRNGPDFFANANLYIRNVLGFVGKGPILQIALRKKAGAKIRTMGRPLKFFVFLSHILLIGDC